jgi:membrane protein
MPDPPGNKGSQPGQDVVRHLRLFPHLRLREYGALLRQAVSAWIDDKAPRLGASLAFYTLLSLAPLLIVVVAVAALVYGQKAAEGQLVWEIQGLVGPEGARTIQGLLRSAYKPGSGAIATIAGIVTLIFGATAVVVELRARFKSLSAKL